MLIIIYRYYCKFTGPGAHPASCKMGTGSFPGVKCGRGVLLTTHPLLVPRSWKSRAIPLPTLWADLKWSNCSCKYSPFYLLCFQPDDGYLASRNM